MSVNQCFSCLKFGLGYKKCSVCRYTHYCSIECQKKDWKEHKNKCKELSIDFLFLKNLRKNYKSWYNITVVVANFYAEKHNLSTHLISITYEDGILSAFIDNIPFKTLVEGIKLMQPGDFSRAGLDKDLRHEVSMKEFLLSIEDTGSLNPFNKEVKILWQYKDITYGDLISCNGSDKDLFLKENALKSDTTIVTTYNGKIRVFVSVDGTTKELVW